MHSQRLTQATTLLAKGLHEGFKVLMIAIADWNPICTMTAPSRIILTCGTNSCSWSSGCWTKTTTFLAKGRHERLKVLMSAISNWNPICAIAAPSRVIFADRIDCCWRSSSCCKIGIKTLAFLAISCIDISTTTISTIIVAFSIVVDVITVIVSLPFWSCTSWRCSSGGGGSRACNSASLKSLHIHWLNFVW